MIPRKHSNISESLQKYRIPDIPKLQPPRWAATGHLQTIWSHMVPSPMDQGPTEEVTIPLADGDRLRAYLHVGTENVIVSMFHGLSGDVTSDYMQRTATLCRRLGYGFLLVNHRGAHTGATLARQLYHSGRGEDVSDCLVYLRSRFPKHQQICLGVSMSGTIVLNLMCGLRGHEKPDAAITVNGPLRLESGAERLRTGLNRIYDFRFVRRLEKDMTFKFQQGLIDKKLKIPLRATIYDFDAMVTGPLTEFGTRENYYASCSPRGNLGKIERPMIILTAADDPFVSVEDYLAEISEISNPNIEFHIEPIGGHLGYFSGPKNELGSNRWLDSFLMKALPRLRSRITSI